MSLVFNYKNKKITDEDISRMINSGLTIECDTKRRELLVELSNTKLRVLKSIMPDIQEICDCLFLKKYMAAVTLTNLLFETMVKLTLVYNEANGRTLADGYTFDNIYAGELKKYGNKNLGDNIEMLCKKNIIDNDVKEKLIELKNTFRNPYSHGSNNQYVETAKTTLYERRLGYDKIKENTVPVTGQPYILLSARRCFIEQKGLSYFAEIVKYIIAFDNKLQKLYCKK